MLFNFIKLNNYIKLIYYKDYYKIKRYTNNKRNLNWLISNKKIIKNNDNTDVILILFQNKNKIKYIKITKHFIQFTSNNLIKQKILKLIKIDNIIYPKKIKQNNISAVFNIKINNYKSWIFYDMIDNYIQNSFSYKKYEKIIIKLSNQNYL